MITHVLDFAIDTPDQGEQAQGDEREVEPAGEEVAEHAHVGVGDHLAAQEILLGNGPEDDAEHDGRAREPELGEHEHVFTLFNGYFRHSELYLFHQ